jgi:addiction module HigA family antidote
MTHTTRIQPTHPGKLLKDDYLAPYGITAAETARATGIPPSRLAEIFAGRRAITADTAIRLARFLHLDPQSFLNLQQHYDTVIAQATYAQRYARIRTSPKISVAGT